MLSVFRRTAPLVALAAVAVTIAACGSKTPPPAFGSADADRFLFERGTEFLARKNWINAREYFRRLVDTYPQSRYRADAKLGIGDSYVGENRVESLILGANEFREFLQFFPLNPRADYAQYRLAYAHHRQMLGAQRDQTATLEALREIQRFLDNYPDSKYRDEVVALHRSAQDRLSEGEFKVGQLYYRIRNYIGALNRFAALLKQDPNYSKRDAVWFYIAETFLKTNALPEALPYYDRILKDMPASEYKERAERRMVEIKRLLDSAAAPGAPKPGAVSGS